MGICGLPRSSEDTFVRCAWKREILEQYAFDIEESMSSLDLNILNEVDFFMVHFSPFSRQSEPHALTNEKHNERLAVPCASYSCMLQQCDIQDSMKY